MVAINDVLSVLQKVKPNGDNHWMACCPVHDDSNPSMQVNLHENGNVSFKCYSCNATSRDIFEKVKSMLPESAKTPVKKERKKIDIKGIESRIIREHNYRDADGKFVMQIVRLKDPKEFRPRVLDGNGKWKFQKVKNPPLYRLPEVKDAIQKETPILLVDGEQDCDSLGKLGFVATCNPFGGSSFGREFANQLKGANVWIIPDHEEADEDGVIIGEVQAKSRFDILQSLGVSSVIIRLPEFINGAKVKDATDAIQAGFTAEDFQKLIDEAPLIVPPVRIERHCCLIPDNAVNNLTCARLVAEALREQDVVMMRDGELMYITPNGKGVDAKPLTPNAAQTVFETYCAFYKQGKKELEPKPLTQSVATMLVNSPIIHDAVPNLNEITCIEAPIMSDGAITWTQKGFNPETGIYTANCAIAETPCDTIEEAIEIFKDILGDFCFDPINYQYTFGCAISYILTGYCRLMLAERAPMFLVDANLEGVGKDTLLKIMPIVIFDEIPSATVPSKGDDAVGKLLFSCCRDRKPYLLISNIDAKISDPQLEAAATSDYLMERVLGASTVKRVPNQAIYALSGNNMTMSSDVARRVIHIYMNYNKDIYDRKFTHTNIVDYVRRNRAKILGACRRFVLNWMDAGMPPASMIKPSFVRWSETVAGMVQCAGFPCPVVPAIGLDEKKLEIIELARVLYSKPSMSINSTGWKVSEMCVEAAALGLCRDIRDIEIPSRSAVTKFGILLKKYNKVDLEGLMIVQDDRARVGYKEYKVVKFEDNKKDINEIISSAITTQGGNDVPF